MDIHQWRQGRQRLRWLLRRGSREGRRAADALGAAGRRLAERLAYRPREAVAVALLAGGLFGGLAIEQWRGRHPAIADGLESEPIRPTSVAAAPLAPQPRARRLGTGPCEEPGANANRSGSVDGSTVAPRLDLNRATPGELARLARIPWRLAARIVAARDGVESRETRPREPELDGAPSGEPPSTPRDPEPAAPTTDAKPP